MYRFFYRMRVDISPLLYFFFVSDIWHISGFKYIWRLYFRAERDWIYSPWNFGLPVFSAFTAGFSALAGAGGGYIIGFLIYAFIISAFSRFYQDSAALHATVMMLSLVACYICGSVWYAFIFNHLNTIPFWNVLLICVLPYIIPDVLKIFLVLIIYKKLNPYFKRLCAKL